MSDLGYKVENGYISVVDPSLDLSIQAPFDPIVIPDSYKVGMEIKEGVHICENEGGCLFIGVQGNPAGEFRRYDPEKQLRACSFYEYDQERGSYLHGPSTTYFSDGTLLSSTLFIRGKKEGWEQEFYLSGSLYSKQLFRDGKKEGVLCTYYENGQLKSEMPYLDDTLEGTVRLFWPDGKLKRELAY